MWAVGVVPEGVLFPADWQNGFWSVLRKPKRTLDKDIVDSAVETFFQPVASIQHRVSAGLILEQHNKVARSIERHGRAVWIWLKIQADQFKIVRLGSAQVMLDLHVHLAAGAEVIRTPKKFVWCGGFLIARVSLIYAARALCRLGDYCDNAVSGHFLEIDRVFPMRHVDDTSCYRSFAPWRHWQRCGAHSRAATEK